MRLHSTTILVMLLAQTPLGVAKTILVPEDYATIQAAIDAAANGDVVLVSAGTYSEHIDFTGKAIRVTSRSGPSVTIIDASSSPGSAVSFQNGEDERSVLEGFHVTGGVAEMGG